MIRTIIIDDNRESIEDLKTGISKYLADSVEVVGSALNYKKAIELIQTLEPELIFLDIELDGMYTAFDLLKEFPAPNFDIVFYTAFDKYAERAFKYSAVDYLLKPIIPEELSQSVERIKERRMLKHTVNKYELLIKNTMHEKPFLLKIGSKNGLFTIVDVNHILYVKNEKLSDKESKNSVPRIVYLNDGYRKLENKYDFIIGNRTKRHYDDLLLIYENFFNASQSALINIHFIHKIDSGNAMVIMKDGNEIPVTHERMPALNKMFNKV